MNSFFEDYTQASGDCVAYRWSGFPIEKCRLRYQLDFQPTGFIYEHQPGMENSQGIGEEFVILISPSATKQRILLGFEELMQSITQDGLYLGDWPTYDPNNTYQLYDQGGRIIGKSED
tara:strand:+ start:326 stop:679 length:354 start_codon:yes stop_codon:yes gene_type:complete